MLDRWKWPLLTVIFCSTWLIIITANEKYDQEQCEQVVFLEGELGMDCNAVWSFDNGMSTIRLCDGTKLQVPTSRIIKIGDK